MSSATYDKAPRYRACAVRERIGYVTRGSTRAKHWLVVMNTTGVVPAIKAERRCKVRCTGNMR